MFIIIIMFAIIFILLFYSKEGKGKLKESAGERNLSQINLVSLFLFLLGSRSTEGCWHSAHTCPPLPESPELYPGGVPCCRSTGRAGPCRNESCDPAQDALELRNRHLQLQFPWAGAHLGMPEMLWVPLPPCPRTPLWESREFTVPVCLLCTLLKRLWFDFFSL